MRLIPFSTLSLLSVAVGISLATTAQAAQPPAPDLSNSEFQQCLDNLKNSSKFSGVDSYTFNNYRPSQPDPSVIQSLNYQPEFQKDVWDYLSALVDKERVEDGIRAKRQWGSTLRQIESRYGVKAEHVLGVWGVESNFGQTLGKKPLFESLATLSCFDRRQSYFQGEYANALKIVQNGDIAPNDMTGSWAGAFGQTQFMPSTFLELAVDFDGDGRRDLVNSVPDALASTANFLDNRGYRTGEPWGYEVKLPDGFWAASNRKDKKSISHWRDQGLTLANGSPLPYDLSSAGLLLPAGMEGPAFLVGKNFDTFYSYNASENYALAIAHL
ncbi:lytic murein transglycosylase, partial [Marinobacter sp. 1Y8]